MRVCRRRCAYRLPDGERDELWAQCRYGDSKATAIWPYRDVPTLSKSCSVSAPFPAGRPHISTAVIRFSFECHDNVDDLSIVRKFSRSYKPGFGTRCRLM